MNQLPSIDRQVFLDSLTQYLNANDQGTLGLLLIDVVNLYKTNHSYGYNYGDQTLQHCFTQLQSISRLPDTVFRIGDHLFAFILPELNSPAFIALAFNKISSLLQQDLIIDEQPIDLDFRIGIALNEATEFTAEKTLLIAEASLKQAKTSQHGSFSLDQTESEINKTQLLEKLFAERLKANDFMLYYQPKVNLQTGEIDSAEALLRWEIAEQKFVSPQVAVEIAEKTGQSLALTKWVIHTAIRQLKDWEKQGLQVSVSVNIPANLIQDPELFTLVQDSLAIWGVHRSRLTLEITESAIIEDIKAGFDNLQKLKQFGVDISIDDFGTGYSSLSYFKQIPANELKIDKSFVLNLLNDTQDQEIVKIIIEIAQLFELKLVAEGIENQQTYDCLKNLGCDYGQGFHMSRPLPAEKFYQLLQSKSPA